MFIKTALSLLLLILFFSCKKQSTNKQLHGDDFIINDSTQKPSVPVNTKKPKYPSFCDTLTIINKKEFIENRIESATIKSNPSFIKKNGIIKVPGTAIIFEDDMTGEGYQEFTPLGNLAPNLYVVAETTYHQVYYHLINNENKTIYHLIGPAKLYGNILLAIEDEHTDGDGMIELWELKADTIALKRKFSLNGCGIIVLHESYLSDGYLYIENMVLHKNSKYYRIRI